MKLYKIHYAASKHTQKVRLAADTPQSLEITDFFRAYHLRSSVFSVLFSFWDENISDTLCKASKLTQKVRLAADTPQSLEITDFFRAYHLRSSVFSVFFSFWDENISDTLVSI
jgi:hypothetical protein